MYWKFLVRYHERSSYAIFFVSRSISPMLPHIQEMEAYLPYFLILYLYNLIRKKLIRSLSLSNSDI